VTNQLCTGWEQYHNVYMRKTNQWPVLNRNSQTSSATHTMASVVAISLQVQPSRFLQTKCNTNYNCDWHAGGKPT